MQYLKYEPHLARYNKSLRTLELQQEEKPIRTTGVLPLDQVITEQSSEGKNWCLIDPESCWMAEDDLKKVCQYDLDELGFNLLTQRPKSFEYLNKFARPDKFVDTLLEKLQTASRQNLDIKHAMTPHYYQWFLDELNRYFDAKKGYDVGKFWQVSKISLFVPMNNLLIGRRACWAWK